MVPADNNSYETKSNNRVRFISGWEFRLSISKLIREMIILSKIYYENVKLLLLMWTKHENMIE